MTRQFECSVYDLLSRHGFLEGYLLIPEEEPLVEQALILSEYVGNC